MFDVFQKVLGSKDLPSSPGKILNRMMMSLRLRRQSCTMKARFIGNQSNTKWCRFCSHYIVQHLLQNDMLMQKTVAILLEVKDSLHPHYFTLVRSAYLPLLRRTVLVQGLIHKITTAYTHTHTRSTAQHRYFKPYTHSNRKQTN